MFVRFQFRSLEQARYTHPPSSVIKGSLSSDVFERRTSTGNRLFAHLSRASEQIFGQIVPLRIKTLGNTNTVA